MGVENEINAISAFNKVVVEVELGKIHKTLAWPFFDSPCQGNLTLKGCFPEYLVVRFKTAVLSIILL